MRSVSAIFSEIVRMSFSGIVHNLFQLVPHFRIGNPVSCAPTALGDKVGFFSAIIVDFPAVYNQRAQFRRDSANGSRCRLPNGGFGHLRYYPTPQQVARLGSPPCQRSRAKSKTKKRHIHFGGSNRASQHMSGPPASVSDFTRDYQFMAASSRSLCSME